MTRLGVSGTTRGSCVHDVVKRMVLLTLLLVAALWVTASPGQRQAVLRAVAGSPAPRDVPGESGGVVPPPAAAGPCTPDPRERGYARVYGEVGRGLQGCVEDRDRLR